ncbi:MAG: histidine utilization repressor [Cellvibrionaceae bacterium]|nr:histidine utilization repressor [Cellvibrionaceae bacterium]
MQARFSQIKAAITEGIENGDMQPGDKVPSENQLAEAHSVSRMTARRALTELVDAGILIRTQGLGTFVSDHRPMSSMLTIRSIHQEIEQRGHRYSNRVVAQQCLPADDTRAAWLGVPLAAQVYHTQVVHHENDLPIQLEDRWVNPAFAPDYIAQDFTSQTTSQYLNQVAPLTQADHVVEAVLATQNQAEQLDLSPQLPCLKITRRTYSAKGIVSFALLLHPGNRYRLGGHLDF